MSSGSRITPDEVRELALLARLRLSDEEVARMTGDLDAILDYVDSPGRARRRLASSR